MFSFWDFTLRPHMQWRIQHLPKKGIVASAHREPKRGSRAPSGVQEQRPWWGVQLRLPSPETYAFLSIFIQKLPKIKYLNENLPPCLRQTASRIQDQRYVLVNGWRSPAPPTAGSATAHMARPLDPTGVFLRPLFCYPKQIPGYIYAPA